MCHWGQVVARGNIEFGPVLKRDFDLWNSGAWTNGGQCALDRRVFDVCESNLGLLRVNPELRTESKLLPHLFMRVEPLLALTFVMTIMPYPL